MEIQIVIFSKILSAIEFKFFSILPNWFIRISRTNRNRTLGVDILYMKDFYRVSQILDFFGKTMSTEEILKYMYRTESELGQDLVASILCNGPGFFVEFGACDGVFASNTYYLEKNLNWNGILCEPIPSYSDSLQINRTCILDLRAVSNSSHLFLEFQEAHLPNLSGLKNRRMDQTSNPEIANEYFVKSISLEDLLTEHNAPNRIDYISIDTEGSEFDVIRDFDFEKFVFSFISIEHNFSGSELLVENLLIHHGYLRILSALSGGDAWYVHNSAV